MSVCPKGSIETEKDLNRLGYKAAKFKDGKECAGCAMCAIICPDSCIEIYRDE